MIHVIPYVVLGYLSGSLLYARFFGFLLAKKDITADSPDGNPGAFNAFHNGGVLCGVLTLCCDLLKGALPLLLFRYFAPDGPTMGLALVMAAPVAGHAWSVFHGFRGGKGIAVSFGCLLGLAPDLRPVLILAAVFLLFSTVIKITPHYYRTLAAYLAAMIIVCKLIPMAEVRLGFLLIAGTVILKLLGSKEEKEAFEVKIGWKS